MKLFKKVISVAATMALVVSAVPSSVKAATDVIDFEDGKIPAGIVIATMDDGSVDGDPAILSVVDFEGSKMLKIDTQENGTPKIKFMLADLVGEENVTKVQGIEYDLVIEQPSGEVAGWNGGTIAAGPWAAGGAWYNGTGFTLENYEKSVTDVTHFKEMITPGFGFTDATGFFMFMNWANNGTDNYIDNVRILDVDGNPMPLLFGDAKEATATATKTSKDVPKTGTTSYALFFLAGAATMATGSVVMKKYRSTSK